MKICYDCSKPSKLGYGRCQRCLDLSSAQQRAYVKRDREKYNKSRVNQKKRYIAAGLCRSCGGIKDPDADEGCAECMNCRLRLTRRV